MFKELKWWWYEWQRFKRLWFATPKSEQLFIKTVGAFWLWRHGVRREFKVRLWRTKSMGWYSVDFAIPHPTRPTGGRAIEVKGGVRKYYGDDIARDQQLISKGWEVMRISEAEIKKDPKLVRREVREFFKG